MSRAQYLTLATISLIASASIFVSGAFLFQVVSNEFGISPFLSLFLALGLALPFGMIALRFFRKAKTEGATNQLAVDKSSSPSPLAG